MAANQAAQTSDACSVACGGACVNEYFSLAATPRSTAAVASGPFTDVGCWNDCGDTGLPSGRTLPYYFGHSNNMTVGFCVQLVRNLGLSYAALQNGDKCRGGDNYTLATILGLGGDCSRACFGNASDTCALCGPFAYADPLLQHSCRRRWLHQPSHLPRPAAGTHVLAHNEPRHSAFALTDAFADTLTDTLTDALALQEPSCAAP